MRVSKASIALVGLAAFALAVPAMAADIKIEVVAAPDPTPGNIGVAEDGTVIVSEHPSSRPKQVAFQIKDGKVSVFPDAQHAAIVTGDNDSGFHPVLGIRVGRDGLVWMLSGNSGQPVKYLYAWDMKAGRLAKEFKFTAPVAAKDSFFNDIALAPQRHALFINDPAGDAPSRCRYRPR